MEFRGFESENEMHARRQEMEQTFGYRLSDLCTCTHPRLGAHTREQHDAKVQARQDRYRAIRDEAEAQRNGGM